MEDSTKTTRTLCICVPISMLLALVLNGCFLQQAITNLPVLALVEHLKWHVAKQSLQRSLNNQILGYKAALDLCENEMVLIRFFGICKDSMISVENLKIEKWYEDGNTVPATHSSHYLVSLTSSRIGPKLISKDESDVDVQSINLYDLCIRFVLMGWHG